jgi:hypothetical protein
MRREAISSARAADGGSAEHDATIPAAAFTSPATADRQGMKPLTKSQRESVLEVARGHPELREALGERSQLLFVEPNLSGRGDEHPGQAVVGIHDYAGGRTLVAVVDPEAKAVVGVEELPVQLQLSDEERKRANKLAAKDERVRSFLEGRDADPLTRLYFPPGGEPSHRYAIVFVRPNTSERRYAVVDLTTREVTDVLDELATRSAHGA